MLGGIHFSLCRGLLALLMVMSALITSWSCGSGAGESDRTRALPDPDLTELDNRADFPLEEREQLEAATQAGDPSSRAEAFGRLGMLYHAYNLHEAALVCYRNGQSFAPEDSRWFYLAAAIHRLIGNNGEAETALSETVRIDPENASAWVSLGELALQDNRLGRAELCFGKAIQLEGDLTAAFIGLGNLAMERGNYRLAVQRYQEALDREPSATVVHYLLGMAFRGLGDTDQARFHLERRGDGQPVLADPLMAEIDLMRHDPEAMRVRGNQAAAAGRFGEALEYYRSALEHNENDPRIWINVGLCRYQLANLDGALEAYQRVISQTDVPAMLAAAHYRIGDILEVQGSTKAFEHYLLALQHNPNDPNIIFRSAEMLRSASRFEQALQLYQQVLQLRPGHDAARLGRALSLIRLSRWKEVSAVLETDITVSPGQPVFKHLHARLLAACPDKALRDGERALSLIREVAAVDTSQEVEETYAMALAEEERFDEAITRQRQAISQAVENGKPVDRLQRNLLAYTRQKPIREPWTTGDPLFLRRNYQPGQ